MSSWKVERGDRIEIHLPPDPKEAGPESFDARWVVADEGSYLVVDKPEGLRPEPTQRNDTTPNLLSMMKTAFGSEIVLAHRLDRDTSGLIIATRPGTIRAQLDEMFRTHTIEKRYEAIVTAPNDLSPSGTIDSLLAPDQDRRDKQCVVERGGKRAITEYEVFQGPAPAAATTGQQRVRLWPRTGRTHQLRVHCASAGAPILGDRLYGEHASAPRLLLHATELQLPLGTGRCYTSPVPF